MRALRLCLFLIVLTIQTLAQNFGEWKIYSDLKDVRSTTIVGNNAWVATGGGVFKRNLIDSSYQILTKAEGLTSQNLTAIANDASNKIWFGSGEGFINIYDQQTGTFQKIVDIYNSSYTKKQVNDIFIKNDSVVTSVDFGLSIISASKNSLLDSYLKFGNFTSGTKVISAIKTKLFFICTEAGIAVQKENAQNLAAPESWDTYPFNTSALSVSSASKFYVFNSEVLMAASNGVHKYQNKSWQPFLITKSKVVDLKGSGNDLYVLKTNRLLRYTNNDTTLIYENAAAQFTSLNLTNDGIYISSNVGLIEIKNGKAKTILPNCPGSNLFINLSIGVDGTLWVATGKDVTGKGFYKFDGTNWTNYNTNTLSGLSTNAFYAVHAGADSTTYFGTWGFGTMFFKQNKFTFYNTTNSGMSGIPSDAMFIVISDIKTDSKGNVWFVNPLSSARQPLSVYGKDKKWRHFIFDNPFISTSEFFDRMVIDQNDIKWFFAIQGSRGIYYLNDKGTLDNTSDDVRGVITKSDGLSSDLINCLAVDRRGSLWIGTNVGLNMISDPTPPKTTITSSIGLSVRNQNVNAIAVDPIDHKWVATNNGVFVFSSDGYQLIDYYNSKNSPLPNDNVISIAIDQKNGIVYMGTDYGLAKLYTSFIEPLESFEELFVYPNPLQLEDGNSSSVTIEGLVRGSTIKIYNITGDLINSVETPGGKIAFWDGRDLNGNYVASGVYVIVAYDEEANNVKTTKVAVIRK